VTRKTDYDRCIDRVSDKQINRANGAIGDSSGKSSRVKLISNLGEIEEANGRKQLEILILILVVCRNGTRADKRRAKSAR